jgi:LPS-assembly lipoprotein
MRPNYGLMIGVLALLALPLSGCIQPLYGPAFDGGSVAAEMQTIAVEPIKDRLGHYLENELIFAFNGTGSHVEPHYRLYVTLSEGVQTPLIDTVTGQASAANVLVTAAFHLDQAGEIIYKDTATVVASYDRTTNRFSSVRAARDAEIRDAERLADQIRTRIAAVLATGERHYKEPPKDPPKEVPKT